MDEGRQEREEHPAELDSATPGVPRGWVSATRGSAC